MGRLAWLALVPALLAVSASGENEPRLEEAAAFDQVRDRLWTLGRPDPLHAKYAELFGEPYPGPRFAPFSDFKPFEHVQRFGDQAALREEGILSQVAATGETVVLSVLVPDSAEQALEVTVNAQRVRIARPPAEETSSRYRFRKARPDLFLPLPDGADPRSAKVSRDGEIVRVVFAREQP